MIRIPTDVQPQNTHLQDGGKYFKCRRTFKTPTTIWRRYESLRGLRRIFAAARLLDCMFEWNREHGYFSWVLCVLSGRGPCDELITHPEEYYRVWCVVMCHLNASWIRWPWTKGDRAAVVLKTNKQATPWEDVRLPQMPKLRWQLSCGIWNRVVLYIYPDMSEAEGWWSPVRTPWSDSYGGGKVNM
jgi:hypothetical protein